MTNEHTKSAGGPNAADGEFIVNLTMREWIDTGEELLARNPALQKLPFSQLYRLHVSYVRWWLKHRSDHTTGSSN
jgi:hypothetical protein